jgi:uncharacterized protein involved in exopolysaccharide biosynthesis
MSDKPVRRSLETEDSRIDVMRYMRVVWRRRLLVLLPVLFITSITAVAVRFMSPLYVSRAKLLVEQRTRVNSELERRIVDEDKRTRRKDRLAQVRMQVTNRDFLEGVIRELGLQNDPAILARARMLHDTRTPDVPTEEIALRLLVRGMRDKIAVRVAEDNMFTITVSDNDPESAYILAKVLARDFVTEVKRDRMEKLEELFKFSSQQQRIYREKVDQAERELREFQSKLIRDQASGSPINITNVTAAQAEVKRLQFDAEQSQQRIANLRDLLREVFNPLPDLKPLRADREVAALERRLRAGLEDEAMTDMMRAPGTVAGFDVNGGTRNVLRRRLSELAEARFQGADAFYRDRIAEYAYEVVAHDAARAAAGSLERMISRYSSRAEAQPELELQLAALQDRVNQARSDLDTFERTLQSAQLSETMLATELAGGVSIADPPEKPVAPIKPNRRRMTLVAFALALIGGLGSIFALEYLDRSFKDIEEIQRTLHLHVVGTIPRVAGGLPFGGMPANKRQHLVLASSVALLLLMLSGMALYERLLRKQHVTVPRARAEEILRGTSSSTQPAAPAAAPAR